MDKKQKASVEIENLVKSKPDLSYVDAVLQWMDSHDIEFTEIKKFMAPALLAKLKNECDSNHQLKSERLNTASLNEFF